VAVRRVERFVARSQANVAVHKAEPHRRAVGQRDVGRVAAHVLGGGGLELWLHAEELLVEVPGRVLVERPAVPLDGIGDRSGVRGEQEHRHVDVCVRQRELLAHRRPVVGTERRRGVTRLGCCRRCRRCC